MMTLGMLGQYFCQLMLHPSLANNTHLRHKNSMEMGVVLLLFMEVNGEGSGFM